LRVLKPHQEPGQVLERSIVRAELLGVEEVRMGSEFP
jgi:hypothetical protein